MLNKHFTLPKCTNTSKKEKLDFLLKIFDIDFLIQNKDYILSNISKISDNYLFVSDEVRTIKIWKYYKLGW